MDGLIAGRNVHFVATHGIHMAAIVTRVVEPEGGVVDLFVFYNDGDLRNARFENDVLFDDAKSPITWHWIEKA